MSCLMGYKKKGLKVKCMIEPIDIDIVRHSLREDILGTSTLSSWIVSDFSRRSLISVFVVLTAL